MPIYPPLSAPLSNTLARTVGPSRLPWEDAGGGTSASALLSARVAALGGWWWDGRTGISLNAGNVQSWTDRVQSVAKSQGTAANQPAYAAGIITTDGVNDFLATTAIGSGLDGATNVFVGACTSAVNNVVCEVGTDGGNRIGLSSSGAGVLPEAFAIKTATVNVWDASAGSFTTAVYIQRGKFSDGAAAAKAVWRNGAAMTGSTSSANDVSGVTTGVGVSIGARVDGNNPTACTVYARLLFPSSISDADATTITGLLRAIYGV